MKARENNFLPKGYINGLTMSNNVSDTSNDLDIAAGECVDSTGLFLLTRAAVLTKRLDATWSVGSGGGGLDTGVKGNSQTYFVHLIRNPSTGVVDALFSLSATAPTMPVGYTIRRRIGIILTDGSGNIRAFYQRGTTYILPPGIDSDIGFTSTSTLYSVTGIPSGIEVEAFGLCAISGVPNATNRAYNIHSALIAFLPPEGYTFSSAGNAARRAHAGGSHQAGDYSNAGHSYGSSEFRTIAVNGQVRIIGNGSATARLTVTGFRDITL